MLTVVMNLITAADSDATIFLLRDYSSAEFFCFVYLQDAPEDNSVESQLSADISCKFCKDDMAPVTLALKVRFFRCSRAALLGHSFLDVTLIQGTRT